MPWGRIKAMQRRNRMVLIVARITNPRQRGFQREGERLARKRPDHPVRIVFPNVPMSTDDGKFCFNKSSEGA